MPPPCFCCMSYGQITLTNLPTLPWPVATHHFSVQYCSLRGFHLTNSRVWRNRNVPGFMTANGVIQISWRSINRYKSWKEGDSLTLYVNLLGLLSPRGRKADETVVPTPNPRCYMIYSFLFHANTRFSNPSDRKREWNGSSAQILSNEQTLSFFGHGDYNVTTCLVCSGSKTCCVIHKQLTTE